MKDSPRILLFDLETSPILGYVWSFYQTDVIRVARDSFVLCVSYSWLGEKEIYTISLPEFKRFKHCRTDDKPLVGAFLKTLNKADIIIAHNGRSFDWKVMNTRLLVHGFKPPNPTKIVDTLKEARKYFRFTSNKQDEISRQLGLVRKERTGGKETWFDCMEGDLRAWKRMVRYNKGDVRQLRELYIKELPWMEHHPNHNLYKPVGKDKVCPNCGSKDIRREGWRYLTAGIYQRIVCKNCGAHSRGERVDYKVPIK